jgi:hypothetical protein
VIARTKLTGKRSSPGMKLTSKLLPLKMSMISSLWVAGLHQGSDGDLDTLLLALGLMLA